MSGDAHHHLFVMAAQAAIHDSVSLARCRDVLEDLTSQAHAVDGRLRGHDGKSSSAVVTSEDLEGSVAS